MALNCSDIPLPKVWLQGLSVCLSRWEMSVLGSGFGAWDPPALGKPREVAPVRGVARRERVRRKAVPGKKNHFSALPSATRAQTSWGSSRGYRHDCACGQG